MKSIEIYYTIADIPDITDRNAFSGQALSFRNEAMDHIEQALLEADAGEWQGAEIGADEVNFGFDVSDFDQAEQIVRAAVAGTRFENFREIVRNEMDMADFEVPEEVADIKPLNFFEVIGLMVFKRMPKRFRDQG